MAPTIICAIEQRTAERVARRGGALAESLGARVVLAHVRKDPPLFNSGVERERARHRTKRRGREILRRARYVLPNGVDADQRVELGVAVDELTEIAGGVDAGLIVVGTRGRGPLASALLGSVSQTLVQQAPCPVMIVPDSASVGTPRPLGDAAREGSTMIAGVDGSKQSSAAASFARELADSLGDRLLIVHLHARAGHPAHVLQTISAHEKARLIVIGAGVRSPRSGSVAARLPRLASCPVIVLPEGATSTLAVPGESDARRAA